MNLAGARYRVLDTSTGVTGASERFAGRARSRNGGHHPASGHSGTQHRYPRLELVENAIDERLAAEV